MARALSGGRRPMLAAVACAGVAGIAALFAACTSLPEAEAARAAPHESCGCCSSAVATNSNASHSCKSFGRIPRSMSRTSSTRASAPTLGCAAGFRHDVATPVQLSAPHPVSAGLTDFTIQDEIYWNFWVAPDVVPLLRTSHPESGNPIAWARTEAKSRVVYLLLGHGPSAHQHASYRRLVGNAIRYVAMR